MKYVVCWTEHMKDGTEEGAKVCSDLDDAKELMNKLGNGFGASCLTVKLFELGQEVPTKQVKRVTRKKMVEERTEFIVAGKE